MNSENIKALIELFGNLGASGKEAFLWYIGLMIFKEVIFFGTVSLVAALVYKLIRKCIGGESHEKALMKLRNRARLGEGYLNDYEVEAVLKHYLKE